MALDASGDVILDPTWQVWVSDDRARWIVGRLDMGDGEQHESLLAFDDARAARAVAATLNAFEAVRP